MKTPNPTPVPEKEKYIYICWKCGTPFSVDNLLDTDKPICDKCFAILKKIDNPLDYQNFITTPVPAKWEKELDTKLVNKAYKVGFNEGYLKALGDVEREIIGEDREYPKVDKGYWLWCNHCQEWVQEAIWHEYPEFHDKCGRKVERKIRIDFQTWDEETTVYNQRGKDILSKLEELRKVNE